MRRQTLQHDGAWRGQLGIATCVVGWVLHNTCMERRIAWITYSFMYIHARLTMVDAFAILYNFGW
jgi:hypothetical protein